MHIRIRSGQSLMELLVGLALGALFIIGSAVIVVPSLQTNKQVANIQVQAQLASGLLNNVVAWGTENWNNILSLATGTANTYYLNTSSSPFTVASGTNPSWNGYTYRSAITVTSSTSIASGTNANFPMLISSALTSWEPTSTGGDIQNLVIAPNGGQEPADLIFTSDSGCTTPLDFETESYSSSTGAIVDWVNVPSLSAGSVIYACYGSSGTKTDQSHPSSTWNSNFAAVYHFPSPTGTLNVNDSTANANNGTNSNTTASPSGQIDGSVNFNGTNGEVLLPNITSMSGGTARTVSVWVYDLGQDGDIFSSGANSSPTYTAFSIYSNVYCQGDIYYQTYGSDNWTGCGLYPTSTWSMITATYTGGTINNSSMFLYVNGVLQGYVGNWTGSGTVNTTNSNFSLGLDPKLNNLPFKGNEDEVELSTVALSSSWILTEYNNQNSPSTFYSIGAPVTNTSGGNHGVQSIVINGVTYQRYFYLTDIYRDASGNPTTVVSGNLYDPSIKEVTVTAGLASSTVPPTIYSMFITNNTSNVFSQSSWSGGGGYSSPATFVSSTFSNSTNTTVNLQGAFELSGGTGNSCVY